MFPTSSVDRMRYMSMELFSQFPDVAVSVCCTCPLPFQIAGCLLLLVKGLRSFQRSVCIDRLCHCSGRPRTLLRLGVFPIQCLSPVLLPTSAWDSGWNNFQYTKLCLFHTRCAPSYPYHVWHSAVWAALVRYTRYIHRSRLLSRWLLLCDIFSFGLFQRITGHFPIATCGSGKCQR